MKKTTLGIVLGIIAGIIDIIPMIIQKLTWDANLSAFLLWVVSGFLIPRTNLKVRGAAKGIIVSSLVLVPSAVLIGWEEPFSLIPIGAMIIILGSLLGFLTEKFGR